MKFRLSSPYGVLEEIRGGVPHTGIDLSMPEGTELRSLFKGTVSRTMDYKDENIGKGVEIQFENGTTGIYGHLSEINVTQGESINEGQLIGLSGNTGHSTGPHLHFGLKDNEGDWVDPTPLLGKINSFSGSDPDLVNGIFHGKGIISHILEDGVKDTIRENAEATTLEIIKGMGDALVNALSELIYSVCLLSFGFLLLTGYIGGHEKSKEYCGLIPILYALLKMLGV